MTAALDQVASYYTGRLAEHGATARGVDWNGSEGQQRRFIELCRVIDADAPASVNDLGCGYGALADYLAEHHPHQIDYRGFDIADAMVMAARDRIGMMPGVSFTIGAQPNHMADYGIASGIFNVRLDASEEEWRAYVETTLDALDATSRRGFAFNCLTRYSDANLIRPDLYYADPLALFDRCKRRYSRNVALLHDYGLYEFTIIVRKPA